MMKENRRQLLGRLLTGLCVIMAIGLLLYQALLLFLLIL